MNVDVSKNEKGTHKSETHCMCLCTMCKCVKATLHSRTKKCISGFCAMIFNEICKINKVHILKIQTHFLCFNVFSHFLKEQLHMEQWDWLLKLFFCGPHSKKNENIACLISRTVMSKQTVQFCSQIGFFPMDKNCRTPKSKKCIFSPLMTKTCEEAKMLLGA